MMEWDVLSVVVLLSLAAASIELISVTREFTSYTEDMITKIILTRGDFRTRQNLPFLL